MRTLSLMIVALALGSAALAQDGAAADGVVALKDAPANAWVKIAQSKTGAREQPVFVYAGTIGRFVMASGMQATGGVVPRHYDTEEFDLAAATWINAYPADVAADRPESGPVGQDYSEKRAKMGWSGPELFYKDGEHLRVGAGGQWLTTRLGYEWCCVPDGGVYVYVQDKTLRYDVAKREWEDLKADPRTSCRIWGSMCYDPVNKEILHAGGDGGTLEIGTWAYNIEKNQWRKLDFDTPALKTLHEQADALCWQAKALLGAAANRFAVSETADEAKADLKAKAGELAAAAEKLSAAVAAAKLDAWQKLAGEAAVQRLNAAATAVNAVAERLASQITPEILGEVRAARVLFEKAADALAVEPPGRARSQIAYDPEDQKIILFGGDQLDRTLSDMWVYDCRTRQWEQRFSKRCPLPRAGHILAWLPKAKRIVLAGGYSRQWLAQEVWTYDVAANEWQMLLHVPMVSEDYGRVSYSPNCPRTDARSTQVGAVGPDDVLVCLGSAGRGLVTWACRIDADRTIPAPEGQTAESGSYTFNRIDPASWEKVANPDPEAARKLYADMPANQWTSLKFARYAPGARNRWGTTAYDVDRHQFLFWGGGHATSHENDVAHFSVLGSCWTLGYHPDDPIETVYAAQPTPISFHNRAHVPVHAYKGYCYDPSAHKMLYFQRAYDPAVREWEAAPYPGLQHRGTMHSQMEPTPAGAVTYSAAGLFRFDAKAGQWVKLPWEGPSPGGIWCDGDCLLYDSKRNCLWLGNRKDIYRYDLATGKARKLTFTKPKALGEFTLWDEQVYLPDDDLVLLMRLFPGPDGKLSNVVWDPNTAKFLWADLSFVENDKPVVFKGNPFSWHDALAYDPELKLILLNNSSAQKVWALKFDRKKANLRPMDE